MRFIVPEHILKRHLVPPGLKGGTINFYAATTPGTTFNTWTSCPGTINPNGWAQGSTVYYECTVNVASNTSVSASFTLGHVLNVSFNSGGNEVYVEAPGTGFNYLCLASISPCQITVPATISQLTLTAFPNTGDAVSSWGGACASVGLTKPTPYTCTLPVTSDITVSTTFAPVETLTANVATAGTGTITPASVNAASGSNVNQTYVVTPSNGYYTSQVLLDNATPLVMTSNNPITNTNAYALSLNNVTANHTITATFSMFNPNTTYTITTNPGAGGNIAYTCSGKPCASPVKAGTMVTFTATPTASTSNTSVNVLGAWGGACAVGTPGTTFNLNSCTLLVNANTTVSASFAQAKQIGDCNALQNIKNDVSGSAITGNYALTKRFSCSSVTSFTPLVSFSGIFDGQGNTVSDLKLPSGGLFSVIYGSAIVRNMTLANVSVTAGGLSLAR